MVSRPRFAAFICACFLGASPITAQEDQAALDLSFEELLSLEVTTASKTKMTARDAPGIISIVTKKQIRDSGARSLGDVLNMVAGFTVGASFQAGFHRNYYIRGNHSLHSEDILILKDGKRLNDAMTGGATTFVFDYPVSGVEQIEIIRGPGSPLYGANAYSGVINIITEKINYDRLQFDLRLGEFDGRHAVARYEKRFHKEVAFSLLVDYRHTYFTDIPVGSFDFLSPPPRDFNRSASTRHENYFNTDRNEMFNLAFKFEYKGWQLSYDHDRVKNANNWGIGIPLDPIVDREGNIHDLTLDELRNREENESNNIALKKVWALNDELQFTFMASYNDKHLTNNTKEGANYRVSNNASGAGIFGSVLSNFGSHTSQVEGTLEWHPSDRDAWVFGLHFLRDEVAEAEILTTSIYAPIGHPLWVFPFSIIGTTNPYPNGDRLLGGSRDVTAASAQYIRRFNDRVSLTLGLRGDDYTDFGGTINPRGAAVFKLHDAWSAKVLWGRAFRAASFYEKGYVNARVILANDNLEPETIETVEVQVEWFPMTYMRLSLAGYHFERKDVIVQIEAPGQIVLLQNQNIGRREGRGLEFEANYNREGFTCYLNYTYADTVEERSGREVPVAAVPAHALNFGLTYTAMKRRMVLNLNGYARWDWTSQDAIPYSFQRSLQTPLIWDELRFEDHTILNFHSEYKLPHRKTSLTFDVRNITDDIERFGDQHLLAPGGIVLGRRQLLAGVRVSF